MQKGPLVRYSDWIQKLHVRSWSEGRFERHLNNTLVHFKGNRDVLVVGFNSQFDIKKDGAVFHPWGSAYAMERDFSFLGFATHMPNWYRDGWPAQKINDLVTEGFFQQFRRVIFAGHSMGGYGALAHAPLVAGADVAAFSPQSTMDRDRVGFDDRFGRSHRLDWSGPGSDAADGLNAIPKVSLFFDPANVEDRRHADRLAGPSVQIYKTFMAGHSSFLFLNRMGVAQTLMDSIVEGTLDAPEFYAAYRNRKYLDWFRNALITHFERDERQTVVDRIKAAHLTFMDSVEDTPTNRTAPDAL